MKPRSQLISMSKDVIVMISPPPFVFREIEMTMFFRFAAEPLDAFGLLYIIFFWKNDKVVVNDISYVMRAHGCR